jgi:dGTPase
MGEHGGFDHNVQSLRVVTRLEHRYPQFDGLNLTWEVLEGLAKHNGPITDDAGAPLSGAVIPPVVAEIDSWRSLKLAWFPSGEAQCASIADDLAYDAHDIDDGLRAGLLDFVELTEVPALGRLAAAIVRDYPGLGPERLVPELVRRLINWLVEDVLTETSRRLGAAEPDSADDIRELGRPAVAFSDVTAESEAAIKKYLRSKLYFSAPVAEVMARAEELVVDLFGRYWHDDSALPPDWRSRPGEAHSDERARHIADFLAGMTDRFALAEYRRLFDRVPDFG